MLVIVGDTKPSIPGQPGVFIRPDVDNVTEMLFRDPAPVALFPVEWPRRAKSCGAALCISNR